MKQYECKICNKDYNEDEVQKVITWHQVEEKRCPVGGERIFKYVPKPSWGLIEGLEVGQLYVVEDICYGLCVMRYLGEEHYGTLVFTVKNEETGTVDDRECIGTFLYYGLLTSEEEIKRYDTRKSLIHKRHKYGYTKSTMPKILYPIGEVGRKKV